MLTAFHTLRHLKPIQFTNRIARRFPRRTPTARIARRAATGTWVEPVFFTPQGPSQDCRLRDYMQHYHESPSPGLIQSWIETNPIGSGAGWEPYPLSRRIPNWIRWALTHPDPGLSPVALRSLGEQAGYLSARVEYHLLANHLFVNAKALIFAGCFLDHDPWLNQGLAILADQIPEQILADGGHFERSPMYHSLILEDLLDLINLGRAYPGLLPDWSPIAGRMLGWLDAMTHPDGRIAFFNDATFGLAPEPAQLHHYAARLGVVTKRTQLGGSGYIRLQNEATVVLFDAAPIGPDYQPGHAHADTLSFEMSHHGRRVIVNSGISTYEAGAQRSFERSAAAHSTARIDGRDQSEMWSAFRVARRARPIDVRTDHQTFAEAAHTGYRRLGITHRRRIELGGRLTVTDSVEGNGAHAVELFFHFHPDARPDIQSSLPLSLESTEYYPGFDLRVSKQTAVARYRGPCPQTFVTSISLR